MADIKEKTSYFVEVIQMSFLKFFTGVIAQPIRAFHLQVGHSTVTSAVVITFGVMTIGLGWTYMVYELNYPREQARVSEIEANTVRMELANTVKITEVGLAPTRPWRYMSVSVDQSQVAISLPVHELGEKMVMYWKEIPKAGDAITPLRSGLLTFDTTTAVSGVFNTVIFSDAFGASWTSGNRLIWEATQYLSDKREQRYIGRKMLITVP